MQRGPVRNQSPEEAKFRAKIMNSMNISCFTYTVKNARKSSTHQLCGCISRIFQITLMQRNLWPSSTNLNWSCAKIPAPREGPWLRNWEQVRPKTKQLTILGKRKERWMRIFFGPARRARNSFATIGTKLSAKYHKSCLKHGTVCMMPKKQNGWKSVEDETKVMQLKISINGQHFIILHCL